MKTAQFAPLAFASALLILSACSNDTAAPPTDEEEETAATLHEVMVEQIDQHADELWEISNTALNETAGIDPSLLTDAQWDEMAMRAGEVEKGARTLAAMDPIVVARPGVKISDEDIEGGHSAAQVQGFVDADPQLFRDLSDTLAGHMAQIVTASRNRDAEALAPLVDQLDGVCESCHLNYWYPEQRELVEQYQRAGINSPAE